MSNNNDGADFFGAAIGWFIGFCIVLYIVVMVVGAILSVVAFVGTVWGGGTALVNYFQSMKENIYDSNFNKLQMPTS